MPPKLVDAVKNPGTNLTTVAAWAMAAETVIGSELKTEAAAAAAATGPPPL